MFNSLRRSYNFILLVSKYEEGVSTIGFFLTKSFKASTNIVKSSSLILLEFEVQLYPLSRIYKCHSS